MLDLQLIYDSLIADGDANMADARLKDLMRLVETFGFYLMHLDIRQESTRHTEAVSEILKQPAGLRRLCRTRRTRTAAIHHRGARDAAAGA